MNRYHIEYKIKTLSHLWEPFEADNIKFEQWNFNKSEGPSGDAWIAYLDIEEKNVFVALDNFYKKLTHLVGVINFVGQCQTKIESQPWMVIRINNNKDKIFFYYNSKEAKGVPLHFDDEEKKSFEILKEYEKNQVFKYLRESTNSISTYTRLAMLIIALESIAGEIVPGKTDKEFIKERILKDEILYNEIFERINGIRNKIFHGKNVKFDKDYIGIIYGKIINFFNSNYNTRINAEVKNPQRTFAENYLVSYSWIRPIDFNKINIRDLSELDLNNKENFDIIDIPKNY